MISDENAGEKICKTCGQVVVQNMVDYSTDGFTDNSQNVRVGPKSTLTIHDGGLSTIIAKSNFDSSGKPISHKFKGQLNRMRIWDSRSRTGSTSNRSLMVALSEIGKLKEKMSLSDAIVERSGYFYRKAVEKKLIRGRTVKAVAGACVYAACRDLGTSRTIKEIAKQIHERQNTIAKAYRLLFQKLCLEVQISDPTSSIVRYCNNLKTPETIKRDALLILDKLKATGVVAGKKPNSVAATVIYMACIKNNKNISQSKISKTSGITEITIRTRLKEFTQYVSLN
ncbi:transcription initiation factor IIB [Nitrosopumilus sp.]|uniref:transcription initiation factor IIB n=1 Tax=Nitrosopumilus sp. TaxID=2024843 RepID=UPI00261A34FA|nr:transcription initiation factor IIB [Nitrosopumilus sp.]